MYRYVYISIGTRHSYLSLKNMKIQIFMTNISLDICSYGFINGYFKSEHFL